MRKYIFICVIAALAAISCSKQKGEPVRMISLGAREKSVECPVEYSACEFYVYADEYVNSRDCTPIDYEAEILDDVSLSLCERREGTFNLLVQRLVYQAVVCVGRVVVGEHIQKAVILALNKRRIHRDVAARHPEGVTNLFTRYVKHLGQLFR